jgi:hypothetical protein
LARFQIKPLRLTGLVVFNKSGCRSRFIVETNQGYAILEWFGGRDPLEGERLVGDFESFGMKDVFTVPGGRNTRVWVEDYWLSISRVREKMADFCN